jgi:hypothetical protein
MRLYHCVLKRFVWLAAGPLAVSAALVTGPPSMAAEDARFVPGKRPLENSTPRAIVRVVSVPARTECPADDIGAMNAVKAFIDPATGTLRAPTPEEEAALARAMAPRAERRAQAARQILVSASGIMSYDLGEEGMVDIVVRTGPDGKPVILCTPRSETAKALTRPLAPQKVEAAGEEK